MTPSARECLLSWANFLVCSFLIVLIGTRPLTLGLLVLLRWSRHLSRVPAAKIFHHWLKACSSSAGPGPLGPYKKNKITSQI